MNSYINTIVLDIPGSLEKLREICELPPYSSYDLPRRYMRELFPLINMEEWTEYLVDSLPEGMVTTFGSIAKAMGSAKASRAVGSICRDLCFHRVVYSDGRVPEGSLKQIAEEIDVEFRNDIPFVNRDHIILDLELDDPPLKSLSIDREHMTGVMRRGHERADHLAGVDISSGNGYHYCAVCGHDLAGEPTGSVCLRGEAGLPYVSGFLFYREGPLILPALERARKNSVIEDGTLLVIDGNGRLHPERMGIACQIGAVTGRMTCGVAKKLMLGRIGEFKRIRPDEEIASVFDGDEIIGNASRRFGESPVYISEGNRCDLNDVTEILLDVKRYRLPEPIRSAHKHANRIRRSKAPSCDL